MFGTADMEDETVVVSSLTLSLSNDLLERFWSTVFDKQSHRDVQFLTISLTINMLQQLCSLMTAGEDGLSEPDEWVFSTRVQLNKGLFRSLVILSNNGD